jgi:hypothetical protein
VCVISSAEAYVFDRLLPVPVLPFPVTLSLHTFAVQYLSPRVLARCTERKVTGTCETRLNHDTY